MNSGSGLLRGADDKDGVVLFAGIHLGNVTLQASQGIV